MARGRTTSLSHRASIPITICWPGKTLQAQVVSLVMCLSMQFHSSTHPTTLSRDLHGRLQKSRCNQQLCRWWCRLSLPYIPQQKEMMPCFGYLLPWLHRREQKATTIELVLCKGGDRRDTVLIPSPLPLVPEKHASARQGFNPKGS